MRNQRALHNTSLAPKKKKYFPVFLVLGCLIILVMLLTIMVGYDLSTQLKPHHPFPFKKETLPSETSDLEQNTTPVYENIKDASSSVSPIPPPVAVAQVLTTIKNNIPMHSYHNSSGWVDTSLEATLKILKAHPLFDIISKNPNAKIENVLIEMQKFEKCIDKPLVITMAKIGTPLYWQLVQNFVYSMTKFDIVECSLMVCISDAHCMDLCQQASFPCYQYDDHSGDISAFQKIANLKLHAVPLAAAKGVSIFLSV
jgi:hypothetical protein